MDDVTSLSTTALAARAREAAQAHRRAGLDLLLLAAQWADHHPDLDAPTTPGSVDVDDLDGVGVESGEFDEWRALPQVHPRAGAGLGTLLGRSSQAADGLIRQALTLRHRLPHVWARVRDGSIDDYRAKRLADLVAGRPDDVCEHLDRHVAPIAHTVGARRLRALLDEAMLRLHDEEVELVRLEALDHRHVTIDATTINHTGVADLSARADWADLAAFDETLSAVAAALAADDAADDQVAESLDVRRSRALGVLADPAAALALLDGRPAPPTRRRRTTLVLHLSGDQLAGRDPVARDESLGIPVLAEAVRHWCGRPHDDLTVLPVIDLNDHVQTEAYEIRGRLRTRSDLINPACVFPWCTRPSSGCDHDHGVPYGVGGRSCDCNVAPLCRRHHRLKTHWGYRVTTLELGTYLWRTPLGLHLLRDPGGTRDVTPDRAPVPPPSRSAAPATAPPPTRPTAPATAPPPTSSPPPARAQAPRPAPPPVPTPGAARASTRGCLREPALAAR